MRRLALVLAALALAAFFLPAPAGATTQWNGCAGQTWTISNPDLPTDWTWRQSHDNGQSDFKTALSSAGGVLTLACARGANGEDGWKPREASTFANNGSFLAHDDYFSGNRDDCIENDGFMPGTVSNVLCDSTFTFMSEQYQDSSSLPSIGPNESHWIYVKHTYVFLHRNSAVDPATPNSYHVGRFFKWQPRGKENHLLDISNSVFAVDEPPTTETGTVDWTHVNFPAGTVFHGTNYVLWLGPVGGYGGVIPAGVTFLEGQAALDKWNEVRNGWLVAHCFAPKDPTDLTSTDDPVVAPMCLGVAS